MIPPTTSAARILDALPVEEPTASTIRIHTPPPARPATYDQDEPPVAGGMKPLLYLKHHWVMVLFLGGLLGSVFAYAAWTLIPSKYTTYSAVRVSPDDPILYSRENQGGRNDFPTYLKTQAGVFRTHLVLHAALREPGIAELPMLKSQVDPVKYLEEELQIETQEGSELIKLKLSGEDPRAIAQIINAVQRVYFREIIEKELTNKKARLQELNDQILAMQREIQGKYVQLNATKPVLEAGTGNDLLHNMGASFAAGQLARFQELLLKLDSEISSHEQRKKALEKRLQVMLDKPEESLETEVPPPPPGFLDSFDKDAALAPLVQQVELLQKRSNYLAKLNKDNPQIEQWTQDIQKLNEKRDKYKQEKLAEYRQAQLIVVEKKLRSDVEAYASALVDLKAQKEQAEKMTRGFHESLTKSGVTGDDVPPDFLRKDIEGRNKTVTAMMDKATLLRLEIKAPPRVTDFQAAAVPQKKETKKQLLATVLAGLMGFALVGLAVVTYEARIKRAMTLADVQQSVLGPMLGVIPASARTQETLDADAVLEAFAKLRSAIAQQFARPGTKTIVLTSARQDEGKTFVAQHLAESLIRTGSRTMLIDFDLRTPLLHTLLQVPNEIGLCEVLRGEQDLANVVKVSPEGLMMLPAGRWNSTVRAILRADRLAELFQSMQEHCDYILINTHPVLNVAETCLISQFADMVLLCVEKFESRLPMVTRAHEKLAALAPESFGIVFVGAGEDECLN